MRIEVESLLRAGDEMTTDPTRRGSVPSAPLPPPPNSPTLSTDDAVHTLLSVELGHHFEIIRELGRGGMGAVYLAREKALERLVAIKVLKPEHATSPERRERFRREAQIAASLSHPGILQLHSFGEVAGMWYFVMGYVRGESLAELLRRRRSLPWPEVNRILVDLASALDCAHRRHVVHRDIKPANVLIEEETGRAVLADFGISKMLGLGDSLTESGVLMGTPHYMSPEQVLGSADIDGRSDIYSLGAVGYTLLCGREPFAGSSMSELLYSRLSNNPTPIRQLNRAIPEHLASAIMKCLAREPLNRWQSAAGLMAALTETGEHREPSLPDAIRDLPSYGPYAFVWSVGWTAFALLSDRSPVERALLLLIAILVPIGLILHVWLTGGEGMGLLQIIRVALRPPQWWSMYWPRSLRQPTDIWSRLPLPARLFRIAVSAFFVIVPTAIIAGGWLRSRGSTSFASSLLTLESVTVAVTAAAVVIGLLWTWRRGLTSAETLRLMVGPTAFSSGWHTPGLIRMLSPESGSVRPPDPLDPADFARAIRQLAPMLPGEFAQVKPAALQLADDAIECLRRQDAQIEGMQRDAGPAEAERVRGRIAALGDVTPNENQERRKLRELLRQEMELVWRMRDRLELVTAQRARRFELLRNVYEVLCESCDTLDPSMDAREMNGRALSLCAELRMELATADA